MQAHDDVAIESDQRSLDGPCGFHVTLLEQASLTNRLGNELEFFSSQAKLEWQALVSDPSAFLKRHVHDTANFLIRWVQTPNRAGALCSSVVLVLTAALAALVLDPIKLVEIPSVHDAAEYDSVITMLPSEVKQTSSSSSGFAATSNGRVGLRSGMGEGSNVEVQRARGGGGGGDKHRYPAQVGKVPQPSEIPAPIPTNAMKNPSLPVAGIKIDPLLWKALPVAQYGSPNSDSQIRSNGPGIGGGMDQGKGQGVGPGNGPGIGPGDNGNTGTGSYQPGSGGVGGGPCGVPNCFGVDNNRVFPPRDVAVRARVLSKPEPQYTEEARKNQITGTVTLRVVFSKSGEIINIRAVHSLPFGLTERAIAAARQIRFLPAMRDGQPVSVHMQLEYNFNLY